MITFIQSSGKIWLNLVQMKPITHLISIQMMPMSLMMISQMKPTSDPLAHCVLSVGIMANRAFVEFLIPEEVQALQFPDVGNSNVGLR